MTSQDSLCSKYTMGPYEAWSRLWVSETLQYDDYDLQCHLEFQGTMGPYRS
jgi:hypothetical protein